ncbi:hypothetical protein CW666_01975 [Macrococcoides caseolyticum]|uniref:hypothetical protein n=1 Tax=Macrococcoides caseolyticum TaxID=69966 RepID=UPI000C334EF8|nr:hypothetical protein [Macrococcus caseolyticus]PKE45336.1 hypothetical protein CW666_01975 [Macrococcus caseolyticus]
MIPNISSDITTYIIRYYNFGEDEIRSIENGFFKSYPEAEKFLTTRNFKWKDADLYENEVLGLEAMITELYEVDY